MTLRRIAALAILPLALVACVETERTTIMPDLSNNPASCGADRANLLIGQPVSALPLRGDDQPLRILDGKGIMTMDLNTARLNVKVDSRNRIVEAYCG